MTAPNYQADLDKVVDLLERWVREASGEEGAGWLRDARSRLQEGGPEWKFYTSFSSAPRHVGKGELELTDEQLRAADSLRGGWYPRDWSADEAARAALLLSYPHDDPEQYVHALEQLFSTADVRESVALYQSLPLLPYPEAFKARAAEGLRSNMTSVFNAVAHHNPYPREYFDEGAWNQMVLKALFVGSPLHPIQGLDERANAELARMLVDYAHERWAAQRTVSPELWRPVGPFAGDDYLEELAIAFKSDEEAEQEAAALALSDAGTPAARDLLQQHPELQRRIAEKELTWHVFKAEGAAVAGRRK